MMQIICHPQIGRMLTQDFTMAKLNLYLQNLDIYVFFLNHRQPELLSKVLTLQ